MSRALAPRKNPTETRSRRSRLPANGAKPSRQRPAVSAAPSPPRRRPRNSQRLSQNPFRSGRFCKNLTVDSPFFAGPFIVRERREFSALILALATLIGGIGFLVSPSHAAFAPSSDLGIWAGLFRFADALNLDHNLVPSLHVAFAVCCVAAFARHASRAGGALLWMWAVAWVPCGS